VISTGAAQAARGVVVLGMGRSGTSSVTRMFQRSGYVVGAEADLMAGDEANPRGYFENWRVYRANEQVLAHVEGTWFEAPGETEQLALDQEAVRPLREVLEHLLSAAGQSPLAVKDPRIGMLIPLWWPLLAGVLHPVMVVRHPLEIALSLERRDGTALPVGLAMWELHLTRLLDGLEGQRVTVVPYERTLEDSHLAAWLVGEASAELQPELLRSVRPAEASSALEPELRRSRVDGLTGTHWLNAGQERLWGLLDSLAPGTVMLRTPAWARQASDEARTLAHHEKRRQRTMLELGSRVEQAGRDLAERDRLLAERNGALAEGARRLAAASTRSSALEEQLTSARDRNRALESQLSTARDECREAQQRLGIADHWLAEIQASRSWRATGPLRAFKRRLRKLVG
jgi:hypothetical protein